MKNAPFSSKQKEFILNSKAKYNLAHGAVRSGKTVATLFRFMQEAARCPGLSIYIIGYSLSTIYRNVISLLFDTEELKFFSQYCTWSKGNHELLFCDRVIRCLGAGDEGSLGTIQGLTIDLVYCDEMTLYPDNVIDMINTRLSREHSKLFASMNPKQPEHKVKKWIDMALDGDPLYYQLHFTIDDNIFLPTSYKENLRKTTSGVFYKRNYLGIWCLADGAIFDFFDRKIHVISRQPAADYYVAGIDYGASNPFACVLVGVRRGDQTMGKRMWVEKEYYWNPKETKRGKTNSEYMRDLIAFFGDYPIKSIYIDPSAASFKHELARAGRHCVDANNDVFEGIQTMTNLMSEGTLQVMKECTNLIREIEGYVWDSKKAERTGEDCPLKVNDHLCDALRYVCHTHKVSAKYEPPASGLGPGRWMMN